MMHTCNAHKCSEPVSTFNSNKTNFSKSISMSEDANLQLCHCI